jgi:predicted phosphodiesterase
MKIGLICDIHEDFQSLREALRQLERRNCDELICLGDIVGYDTSCNEPAPTRDSSACIAAVRSNCRHVVIGNHDLFALKRIPRPTHAFPFPPNWYQLSLDERRALSNNRVWLFETESTATYLNRRERKYLEGLPEHLVLKCNNQVIHLSHSLHPDLTGSSMLRPHNPWELREHFQILKGNGCSYGFSGHTHPNGILIGRENDIRGASFGRLKLEKSLAHYSCPGLANGTSKRGFTIVDFDEMTIETSKLGDRKNRWEKWYERLRKKNQS